jgi:hypothetical protein
MSQELQYKEEKITSPIDGSDRCFRVYTEPASTDHYLCMTTGYMSTTDMKVGSDSLTKEIERSPELIGAVQHYDGERDIVWIPTIMNIPGKGMIFPDGNLESWKWSHASVVPIAEEDRKNYPIPNKDGEYFDSKLDVDNAKKFDKFYEACISMGVLTKDFKGSLMNAK